jgi:prolipoprotein diacylglyceryl transferase
MSAGFSSAPQLASQTLASIPSPTQSVWHLGPLPIRAYAICIVLGIFVALAITERRWKARGGQPDQLGDIAAWGIIFGILGGRIYHVITTPDPYFGEGGHPFNVVKVYEGGLGIWGAIALGGLGVYIGCRRKGVRFTVFADAAAPGIVLAQAFGRWGNYFNNELYGRATDLPWGLEIHEISLDTGKAAVDADGHAIVLGTFHPTFLYESIWCILVCFALLAADQRYRMGRGRLLALYAVLYSLGRAVIESLRIDDAHHLLGLRLNEWTSLVVILGGIAWIVTHPGPREESVFREDHDSDTEPVADFKSDADIKPDTASDVDAVPSGNETDTNASPDDDADTAEAARGGRSTS